MMTKVCRYLVCGLILCIAGCTEKPKTGILAKVGDAVLTADDLKGSLDTSGGAIRDQQMEAYTLAWVNQELLYQEALRKGLDKSEEFLLQLKDAERQLLVGDYLEREIYKGFPEPTDSSMKEYFESHRDEFFVREDIAKLDLITFGKRETANRLVSKISHAVEWDTAVEEILADSEAGPDVVVNVQDKMYTQHTLFPAELWRVASSLSAGEISFPVKTSFGYSILKLLAKIKAGSPADFDVARDEVRQRILVEERKKAYEKNLEDLRKRYKVELFINSKKVSESVQ